MSAILMRTLGNGETGMVISDGFKSRSVYLDSSVISEASSPDGFSN